MFVTLMYISICTPTSWEGFLSYLRCTGETGVWVGGAEKDLGLAAAVAAGISELMMGATRTPDWM